MSEQLRINSKDVTLDDLKLNEFEGYMGSLYRIELEVPCKYVERSEEGPVFAFNIKDKDLSELFLGVSSGIISSFYEDKVLLEITFSSQYLRLVLSDLRRVNNAVLITQNR